MSDAFDLLLVLLVAALTLRLLTSRDLFETIVLFVSFGLAMALVWVRIGAVDVALAEAALGAGVTGALLVNTMRRVAWKAPAWLEAPPRSRSTAVLPVLCGALAGAAALAIAGVATADAPLAPVVLERVADTGVSHPVTAVLLDFRAWDTLLEMGVLLGGLVAVWALERGRPAVPPRASALGEPVLAALVRWIVPITIITAIHLIWLGSHAPGGAFQAGALLAGAGVLLLAAGFMQPYRSGSALMRVTAAAGLFVFCAVALWTTVTQGFMLRYPDASAHLWILAIEAVLALSIAAILADLFVDVPAVTAAREPP